MTELIGQVESDEARQLDRGHSLDIFLGVDEQVVHIEQTVEPDDFLQLGELIAFDRDFFWQLPAVTFEKILVMLDLLRRLIVNGLVDFEIKEDEHAENVHQIESALLVGHEHLFGVQHILDDCVELFRGQNRLELLELAFQLLDVGGVIFGWSRRLARETVLGFDDPIEALSEVDDLRKKLQKIINDQNAEVGVEQVDQSSAIEPRQGQVAQRNHDVDFLEARVHWWLSEEATLEVDRNEKEDEHHLDQLLVEQPQILEQAFVFPVLHDLAEDFEVGLEILRLGEEMLLDHQIVPRCVFRFGHKIGNEPF